MSLNTIVETIEAEIKSIVEETEEHYRRKLVDSLKTYLGDDVPGLKNIQNDVEYLDYLPIKVIEQVERFRTQIEQLKIERNTMESKLAKWDELPF